MNYALLILAMLITSTATQAAVTSYSVPLKEQKSSPAIDLIQNGASIDRDLLLDQIKNGFDSSVLEPQLSILYRGTPQPLVQYASIPYPNENDTVNFDIQLPGVDGLVRGRVTLESNAQIAYQMNFSLDQHASMVRNALMRRIGYDIPSPKYYHKLKIRFHTLDERNAFLESVGGDTLTARERWVVGGMDEINGTNLVMNFHDIVLEPALITTPQLHWGILTTESIASRRSIRALLVPLTLVDVPESVNMYSFEPVKVYNEAVTFNRVNADKFANETSIGDVKWIAKKIAKLTRQDWVQIVQAGQYPADIQALIVEKTIGRVDQLMKVLQIPGFTPIPYDEYVTIGKVLKGKATQELYDGYALRFCYGDPQSPLRASELARFFTLEGINGGMAYYLNKANDYFQIITKQKYIDEHGQEFSDELTQHFTDHPDTPFVAPIKLFGGVTAGGSFNASRSIVTGTYYGSSSQVQLVDSISAGMSVGAFYGLAGISSYGISMGPVSNYTRSYVHVRPLTDIKSALKDNWAHILVPGFMASLAKVLTKGTDADLDDAIKNFLAKMQTGEMFIVTDGLTAGGAVDVQIPIEAMLGLVSPISAVTGEVTASSQYAILSRVTIYRADDGIHVYLDRMHSGSFTAEGSVDFFIRAVDFTAAYSKGKSDAKAYIFPESFDSAQKSKDFRNAIVQILRRNNPNEMEASFKPYQMTHETSGHRFRLAVGPWSWSRRETLHQLNITPPPSPTATPDPSATPTPPPVTVASATPNPFTRTVYSGQITKINGSDYFGFFSKLLKKVASYIDLSPNAQGDDPSANFLGNSKTFVVSTEIETTPNRENHPFTKVQQALTGWVMKKSTLLKVLNGISSQIGEFSPSGGLIDASEFSQTNKIEAYTILWNLLVYEKGSQNVFNALNVNTMKTSEVYNFLIDLMGKGEYEKFCSEARLPPKLFTGPFDNKDAAYTRVESSQGQTTFVACAPPLMVTVYDLRKKLASHPEVFKTGIHNRHDAVAKIKLTNDVFLQLNSHLELSQLIRWVGKENSFFQVRLSGFRTHDENADFKSAYYSNTVGLIDQVALGGPLSDIENTTKISSHEIEARYLSDGY